MSMDENLSTDLSQQQDGADFAAKKESSHHHHHSSGKSHHHHSSSKKSSHHHHHSSGSPHHHHASHTKSSKSHHHHSSSEKSKKKSHRKKKTNIEHSKLKVVFSFLLFVSIFATAIFAGLKITVLNENRVAEVFTDREYVDALYNDILDYSKDACMKCGIPTDSVKEVITFKNINDIQTAYVNGVLNMDERYTDTSYLNRINKLNARIEKATLNMIEDKGLTVSEKQKDLGVKTFSAEIASYIKSSVEFEYISNVQSWLNVSSPIINVGIALFAVLALAFFLLAISIEGKNYRSLRPVVYSFTGASMLTLILIAFVGIVSLFKDLVIYPTYLCDSIMRYINSCTLTYLFEAFLLFFTGVVISALVWRLKRNNE